MPSPVLTLLKEITLNLDTPNDLVYVSAKQYDVLARKVKINLVHNAAPWVIPSGLGGVIRYIKPDQTRGMYDTDDDGNPAIVITAGSSAASPGNITITLAKQVLTTKGTIKIEVSLYSAAAEKLTTFSFPLVVEEAALSDIPFYESEDYFNFRSDMATIQQLNDAFATATQAAVSGVLTIDNTLSIAGAIADAKAAGDMIRVSETEPAETSNILWIKDPDEEVVVPTWEDFESITEQTYNLVTGVKPKTGMNYTGVLNSDLATDIYKAPVTEGETYTINTNDSSGLVCAFYSVDPFSNGAEAYDQTRIVQANKTITSPITGYIAFRVLTDYSFAQIVVGEESRPYIKPITAIDVIARSDISNLSDTIDEISEDILDINNSITDNIFDQRFSTKMLNGFKNGMFDVENKYYTTSGGQGTSSAYVLSEEYIPIKPNTEYAIYNFSSTVQRISGHATCFYDINKKFISQTYQVLSFTSPANAFWLRTSIYKEYRDKPVLFEYIDGETPEYYKDQTYINLPLSNKQELKNAVYDFDIDTLKAKVNVIPGIVESWSDSLQGTIHAGGYMNINGTVISASDWKYIVFDAEPYTTYRARSGSGQNARLWLVADEYGNIIQKSDDSSAVSYKEEQFVTNGRASKIIMNSITNNYYLKKFTGYSYIDATQLQPLYGKTLVCCGDSITYGTDMDQEGIVDTSLIDVYQSNSSGDFSQVTSNFLKTYGYQIAERNNMIFYNAGVSGSTMQGLSNKNGFSLANGRYTKLPDSLDYLTIWFGWNDAAYGTLGTINDNTNESYYGGYNVVLPYLINKYPNAKIGLIVPFGASSGHRNAIRELGNKWGLAVFDNYGPQTPLYYGKESSVGVDNDIVTLRHNTWQANGAHPNFKGHYQLSTQIEHWLRSL